MAARESIRLDGDDTIAAAQICAWIARPNRPESAMKVLDHWRRELQREWGKPDPVPNDVLMKRNRIIPQFIRLEAECLTAFRAGQWLQAHFLKTTPHKWFNAFDRGVTALAADRVGMDDRGNEIARVWSKRKAVAPMCLAAGNALGRHHQERGWVGFGLTGSILQPQWVQEAIEQSEQWQHTVSRLAAPWPTIRFHRD